MFKQLFDRLVYALIGLVFGALAAAVLWIFVHHHGIDGVFEHGFGTWLEILSSVFAVIGFVAKDRVGDAIGGALDETFKATVREPEIPWWVVAAAVVVAVSAAVWHVART